MLRFVHASQSLTTAILPPTGKVNFVFETEEKVEAENFAARVQAADRPLGSIVDVRYDKSDGNTYTIQINTLGIPDISDALPSRTLNPPHASERRGFVEVLDVSFHSGDSFSDFINKILLEWSINDKPLSPERFVNWVRGIGVNSSLSRTNISAKAVYDWIEKPNYRPAAKTVEKLVTAFVPPNPFLDVVFSDFPHLKYRHLLKLHRLTGLPLGPTVIQEFIDATPKAWNGVEEKVAYDAFLEKLIQNSGINPEALKELCGDLPFFYAYTRGFERQPQNVDRVRAFFNLTNPPTLSVLQSENPVIVSQNQNLTNIITGKTLGLSFDEMHQQALQAKNPSTAFFDMLMGQITITDEALAEYLTSELNLPADKAFTKDMVVFRRCGRTQFSAAEARAIAKKIGCTPQQTNICLETLTGHRLPDHLLDGVLKGDPDIQTSAKEICSSVRFYAGKRKTDCGVTSTTLVHVETGDTVKINSANELASGLGFANGHHRAFTLLALRRPVFNAKHMIEEMRKAQANLYLRAPTLTLIIDQIGLGRVEIAHKLGIGYKAFKEWEKTGEIISDFPLGNYVAELLYLRGGEAIAFADGFNTAFISKRPPRQPKTSVDSSPLFV